ncbi:MAG TPA: tRNA (adenosine(37)-N6)-threonylcarbamoyltransferase complex dimerization subunit type 1 TsaB [Nocardioidaceae bacterium]|nr:tRNA (adenosine(37)-N6)-threonylcarbamoyltransferase complex dimerization subunit type 1 TsaB [Nocardioidaceae bacterium]
MLLALDTATQSVTVAVHNGEQVVAESSVVDPLRHGELLAPGIEAALREAGADIRDLTGIAVGVGPGPFTGLRVGIMTARTMSLALGVPVYGVCTLDVLAFAVQTDGPFVVATDARRKEVYWARYDHPTVRVSEPAVDRPVAVATELPAAGRGAAMYPDSFPHPIEPEYPRAGDLASIVVSGAARVLAPEPLYLRRPDVAEPAPRKRVS